MSTGAVTGYEKQHQKRDKMIFFLPPPHSLKSNFAPAYTNFRFFHFFLLKSDLILSQVQRESSGCVAEQKLYWRSRAV